MMSMNPEAWESGPPDGLFDDEAPSAPDFVAVPALAEPPSRSRVAVPWRVGDHVEIADRMLERIEGGGPRVVFSGGVFWAYCADSGIWTELDPAEMSVVIQGFSGARIPAADGTSRPLKIKATDVKGSIDIASHQRRVPDEWFRDVPAGLAFSDGFLRVSGDEAKLERFSPAARARHAYPFPFAASYDAAPWLKFLAGLFQGDDDAAEKQAFLQEFFGACLLGVATRYQRALFCTGKGRNGKSTLFTILRSIFPPRTVTEIAPHSLRDDYSRAALAGKLLNIVAEASTRELLDTESFKALVTGDAMQARQPYGRKFTLFPKAGHAFAPQELPDVADSSDGFWRRPVVVEFRRQFTDADDDKGLAERLIETAQPAILAWLIEGAQRLLANRVYTTPASHAAALNRWRKASNNVALFAEEMLLPARATAPIGVHDWTASATIYEKYRAWVATNGYRAFAANAFGRRLAALGFASSHTERGTMYAAKVVGLYDAMQQV